MLMRYRLFFKVFEVIQCQLFLLLIYNLQILHIFNTDNSLYAEKIMYIQELCIYIFTYLHTFCNFLQYFL